MDAQRIKRTVQLVRTLLLLRLALLGMFLVVVLLVYASCGTGVLLSLGLILLIMAVGPLLAYAFRRHLTNLRLVHLGIALCDFLLACLANLLAVQLQGTPFLFPLLFIVVIEAACWWNWPGALVTGAASWAILSFLYLKSSLLLPRHGLALLALVLGWTAFLSYLAQWALQLWHERQEIADRLVQQAEVLRQARGLFHASAEIFAHLVEAPSDQALLEETLRWAIEGTASTLGLIVLQEANHKQARVACWDGFALPHLGKATLQPGERLPPPTGDQPIEVCCVLESPLTASTDPEPGGAPTTRGRVLVARHQAIPYRESDQRWLDLLTNYLAVLLENRALQGQLGQFQRETDSVILARSALASLSNPASALEMACRDVLGAMGLDRVELFLYRHDQQAGCHVLTYAADGPAHVAKTSLQGRGLRLLRRFLDSGTPLVANHPSECPEIFEAMGWRDDVQSVACFPLQALQYCWGTICLLAQRPRAFPSRTQQNLVIFSGEVAVALENTYLRQVLSKTVI